ncbi:MAG: hypothetical protein J5843_00455, partial [Clostridia bacterium]|nr:hypothetical protein [Clostridia bacterium]
MDNRERTIFDATAHLDERLVAELTDGNGPKAGRRKWLIPLIATLVAVALLAGSLTGLFLYERDTPLGTDSSQPAESGSGGEGEVLALTPWKSGKLHVTTLVYRNNPMTLCASARPDSAMKLLSAVSGTPETVPEEADEGTAGSAGTNVTVSIQPDTRISAFSGTDLIRVELSEGEHAGCDGVWYDVRNDEIVCLSCRIRESVCTTPEYLDACIRLAIESGLISNDAVLAAMIDEEYRSLYEHLNRPSVLAFFASGVQPTVEGLELAETEWDVSRVRKALARYTYPTVHVLEYGTDPRYCLYALTNAERTLSYGTFLFDVSARTAEKLDGNAIGKSGSLNGIGLLEGDRLANLALATEIRVQEDYGRIVSEVPYILGSPHYNEETNVLTPGYAASTLAVYGRGAEPYLLADRYGDADPVASAP